ncbi:MAG: hypothetical protein ACP5K9_02610 [Candidatus Micrarchaeia archaeon]
MDGKKLFALVLVFSTFLGAVGQLLFKMGVNSSSLAEFAILVSLGFISYAISTVMYFYVLSRAQLSWVYNFGGMSYIFTVFLALFVLNEAISPLRWTGIALIIIGVTAIGLS